MGKGKNSASSGGSRSNGSAAGAAGSASGNNTTTSTPATPVRDAEQSSTNDDNPQTPTKRSSMRPSPPPYEATATQLEVYSGKQRACRDCPRCVWPLILNPHNDPRKHPRPACPRWQFDDCAFLGLQIHFGGKFCWVCGVKFVEGDIVWVYVPEDGSGVENFCLTDEDCLKKRDKEGFPVRVRKANTSDVEKGCFDCHKPDNTITVGQQVVSERTTNPRHAAYVYKSRQNAIDYINGIADERSEASSSAKAARRDSAKRFAAKGKTPDDERLQPGEALDF